MNQKQTFVLMKDGSIFSAGENDQHELGRSLNQETDFGLSPFMIGPTVPYAARTIGPFRRRAATDRARSDTNFDW